MTHKRAALFFGLGRMLAFVTKHPPRNSLRVALLQNSAGSEPDENCRTINRLIAAAPADADLIALPETFALRGSQDDERRSAAPTPSALTRRLSAIAFERRCWLVAGSVIERRATGIYNTCLVFDRTGRIRARYRKIHLFDAALDADSVIRETALFKAGSRPVMLDIEGWRCGLSICYDLRFPELFRFYAARGAHLMFVPSNFTHRTGRDHWETLIRARAIENQCFVAAPNQCGRNPCTGTASYGHSLIAGPWGEVLAHAGERETCVHATLEPARLADARRQVPALDHRRIGRISGK